MKRSKWDNIIIIAVLCLAVGLSLTACGQGHYNCGYSQWHGKNCSYAIADRDHHCDRYRYPQYSGRSWLRKRRLNGDLHGDADFHMNTNTNNR